VEDAVQVNGMVKHVLYYQDTSPESQAIT
jgi:hypothetical protein